MVVVETRLNAWKRTYGSSHWSELLDVSFLDESSTYHSTIKAIPYEVVLNRQPTYKRFDSGLRPIITENGIKRHMDDERDDALIVAD